MGRKRSEGNERLGEYIQRKAGGSLELRIPIPEDVRPAFSTQDGKPKKLFIQSLRTTDTKLANDRADPIRADFKAQVTRIQSARKNGALPAFLAKIYAWELDKAQPPKESDAKLERQRARFGVEDPKVVLLPPRSVSEAIQRLRAAPAKPASRLDDQTFHGVKLLSAVGAERHALAGWMADDYFESELGLRPDPTSSAYEEVLDRCIETLADALEAKMDIEAGKSPPPMVSKPATRPSERGEDGNHATSEKGRMPLSIYFEESYLPALRLSKRTPGERYLDEKRYSVKVFVSLIGDKPLWQITNSDMWDFCDKLRAMPSTGALTDGWRKKTPREVYEAAQRGQFGNEVLSAATVNKRLSGISTLLEHAKKRRDIHVYVAGDVRAEDDQNEDTGRAFTREELKRIFQQPLFTGSRDGDGKHGYLKPGTVEIRDDRFWIPLTLFLTGCRASEAIGVLLDEVNIDHVTPHFTIQVNRIRGLKNPQSKRMLPIHPYLVRAGFFEFVERQRRQGHDRLFPMAEQHFYEDAATGGKRPKSLSTALIVRHFNRSILKSADAKLNGGSIKCFRNTFEEEAFSKVSDEEIRLRLTGRRVNNSSDIYKQYIPHDPVIRDQRLLRLDDAIQSMTFDGVDLSHLWKS